MSNFMLIDTLYSMYGQKVQILQSFEYFGLHFLNLSSICVKFGMLAL